MFSGPLYSTLQLSIPFHSSDLHTAALESESALANSILETIKTNPDSIRMSLFFYGSFYQ